MITCKNLTVSVKDKKILTNFNFAFEKGKTYAIMGPNGSGKSTFAYSIMGHPSYIIHPKSRIDFDSKNITSYSADKRAQLGVFLSFQTPLSLSGITVFQLLRLALSGKREPLEIKNELEQYAKKLSISSELLERSLNENTSGGEKKKLEVLQSMILKPKFVIFDEIDTGVDVDSIELIAKFLKKMQQGKTYVLITHYTRILKYMKPDIVLIIKEGKLIKTGDYSLAQEIDTQGYEHIH